MCDVKKVNRKCINFVQNNIILAKNDENKPKANLEVNKYFNIAYLFANQINSIYFRIPNQPKTSHFIYQLVTDCFKQVIIYKTIL